MNAIPKIMVVDDEVGICKNVEKILKKGNYAVTRASSAKEALDIMAKESFSLLISDIVMPEMNGLQLLQMVKKEWPVTRAVMMTAYASTDTAVKAIRMGALDYIPKPFTPDELRATVENALSGKLVEAKISEQARESIDIIDVDIPFDADQVAKVTGKGYADTLGPSDMPVVEVKMPEALEGFCEMGNMVCDIFKKLGTTCKAGTKNEVCPQLAKKKKGAAKKKTVDTKTLIGIDQPFDYDEVAAVSGPEYIHNLRSDGVSIPYYEDLKANIARLAERNRIDVDVPFDIDEVAQVTGKAYAEHATRTDVPIVEISASEPVEGFCEVGDMVCDIFKKLGATCKAGIKTAACPQLAKKKRAAAKKAVADTATLIAPDMPFNYDEVLQVTGRDYVDHLVYDGTVQMPYETLKANMEKLMAAEAQEAAPRRVDQVPAHPSILVVDDEVAVNNNIRKILAKKGYQVDQAVTRNEAMDSIVAKDYSLVLLDLRIPGVKGLELLKAVVDKNPDTKVIMITGYASIETAVEAARMGAVDYLPKPFTPDEIRNATERAFQIAA